jgi:arsenite-transporting ATPase
MVAVTSRVQSTVDALLERRLLIVSGKGGTGKTTLAAALALAGAARGKRVLAAEVGTDVAAPAALLAALDPGKKPSIEPQKLSANLSHVLVRADDGLRGFLRDVLPFKFLADRALKLESLQRFLAAGPAFAEMGILYRGLQFLRAQERGRPLYDVVLLDAPATGHALAFASLPDTVLRILPSGPIGTAAREGQALLRDPARCAAVVTVLPEPLPTTEALELASGLRARGVTLGAMVANFTVGDPLTAEERAAIEPLLGNANLLGRQTLTKAERSQAAIARLRTAGAPLLTLPRLDARGAALSRSLCQSLLESP